MSNMHQHLTADSCESHTQQEVRVSVRDILQKYTVQRVRLVFHVVDVNMESGTTPRLYSAHTITVYYWCLCT